MRAFVICLATLGVVLAGAAAADAPKPDITGTITRLDPANEQARKNDILGTLLVEAGNDQAAHYPKVIVHVSGKTKIEKPASGGPKAATFAELKKGGKVQVTFTGPIAKSEPPQATAASILIVD